jgi:hypothetical protein
VASREKVRDRDRDEVETKDRGIARESKSTSKEKSKSMPEKGDREDGTERSTRTGRDEEKEEEEEQEEEGLNDDAVRAENERAAAKAAKNTKIFDKMFKTKKSAAEVDAAAATAAKAAQSFPEGSVEYWNHMREALGMKKLR